ncbi:hypothetical protein HAHE_07540 [Haloferula helveola]|uniref:PEP-CTERM protein-sorting domain-containing protein n=1 Tax=Haloferula helveola TaxID=490095 RepID=A0ABM7R7P6_9BACT|nr:hypothetical protein HAHE_07540 [Haloferula helveola]
MKPSRLAIFVAACGCLTGAHAAVTLQDSYAPAVAGGAPTQLDGGAGPWGYEINISTSDFSAAGHGKLVMVYSSKDEAGGADLAGATVTGISYAGVALNTAFFSASDSDRVGVGIYYLDNVAADGTLRIELADGGQTEFGFGLYAVDGLKLGVQDVQSGRATIADATISLTTASGFLVQEAARNNQSLTADAGDAWQTLYDYNGPQSYQALSQYQVVDGTGPGSYLAPINNTGANFRLIAGAAFEAIPEPGSSLLVLSGLSLLVLKRRRL